MTRFKFERETVRLRNATVTAVASQTVTIGIDGGTIPGVPVYGPMPAVNARVLVLEQENSLLVLGNAVSLVAEIEDMRSRLTELEANHGR